MPKMTTQELQISALKREVVRLNQELELAQQRTRDEQDTILAIESLCCGYGYEPQVEYLGDWLEGRLDNGQ